MEQPSDYAWLGISIFGVLLVLSGCLYAVHAHKTWDWPKTRATITRVGDVNPNSSEGETWYECNFAYVYTVGGKENSVEHLASFNVEDFVHLIKSLRQPGTQFDLYYNEKNHEQILRNGPKSPGHGYSFAIDGLTAIAATSPLLIWDLHWSVPTLIGSIGVVLGILVHNRYMSKWYPFERRFPHIDSYLRSASPRE